MSTCRTSPSKTPSDPEGPWMETYILPPQAFVMLSGRGPTATEPRMSAEATELPRRAEPASARAVILGRVLVMPQSIARTAPTLVCERREVTARGPASSAEKGLGFQPF